MNIVTVTKDRYTVDPLYQWDLNQSLEIRGLSLPSTPEIHFTNDSMDRAIVRQATMNNAGIITVDIPNGLLQKPYTIKAYVCIYVGDTFKSLYLISIPVKARPKPNDYTIEDDPDIYSFNALENSVNNILAKYTLVDQRYNTAIQLYNASAKRMDEYDARISETERIASEYAEIVESAKNIINGASNMAFSEVGKYTGTGSSNPNSLTFNFIPKFIYIIGGEYCGVIFPNSPIGMCYQFSAPYTTKLTVSLSGTTVEWYSDLLAPAQLNQSTTVYHYVAIG